MIKTGVHNQLHMGDLFENFINPDSGVRTKTRPVEFVATSRQKRGAFSLQTRVGRMLKASEAVKVWLKDIEKNSKKQHKLSHFPSHFTLPKTVTESSNKSVHTIHLPQAVVPGQYCKYTCPVCSALIDTDDVVCFSHLTSPFIMMCSECTDISKKTNGSVY